MRTVLGLLMLALLGVAQPAEAISFNLTFDPSTLTAPAGFLTAFNDQIAVYQTAFTDPITINLHVGWGDIDGRPLTPGFIGQSLTNQQIAFYPGLKAALIADAKTSADAAAVASLPVTDPTGGNAFEMSNAEAKALGLLSGSATGIDGWVGFSNTTSYTFDPNNRSVAGEVDFAGLADHEISEVMGRYGFGQNGSSGDSPIDLFRYTGPGVRDLAPACSGTPNYFSVNDGANVVNTFNTSCPDDRSDWAGVTPDAFNAVIPAGHELPLTTGDLELMDVLGYDLAATTAAPEPSTLVLLVLSLPMAVGWSRRRFRAYL